MMLIVQVNPPARARTLDTSDKEQMYEPVDFWFFRERRVAVVVLSPVGLTLQTNTLKSKSPMFLNVYSNSLLGQSHERREQT